MRRSDDSQRRRRKSADSPPSQCSLVCQTERESRANGEGQMIARVKKRRGKWRVQVRVIYSIGRRRERWEIEEGRRKEVEVKIARPFMIVRK